GDALRRQVPEWEETAARCRAVECLLCRDRACLFPARRAGHRRETRYRRAAPPRCRIARSGRVPIMTEDNRLNRAFSLKTPQNSVRLYRDWADSYDETFADAFGYIAPREVAAAFRAATESQPGGSVEPVLDIGAGTGLLAAELAGFT